MENDKDRDEFTPSKANAGNWVKTQLRFPTQEMYERMKELAHDDGRSLNGEIIQAIKEFIARRDVE